MGKIEGDIVIHMLQIMISELHALAITGDYHNTTE